MNTDAIRQWVANTTGLVTTWVPNNAPRPARPYASIQVISSPRIHRASYAPVDAEGNADITSDVEVTLSINVYAAADGYDPRVAFNACQDLRNSLELISVRETLKGDGWAFRAVEMLQDTPQLMDTQWEPRATFDVRFGTTVTQADNLGLIETVDIEGSVYVAKDKQDTISNVKLSSATFVHVGSEDIKLSEKDGNILRIDEDGRLFAVPLLETRNW